MKSLRSLSILIVWFCYTSTPLQAQGLRFENVVNEQFGTLLESLLKDGKLDETSAKTYLETVFGYDEAVNKYLQSVDLGKQLANIKQGKLSIDQYLPTINEQIIGLIPENYRKKMFESPYYQGTLIGQELKSGRLSEQTAQLISNSFQNIIDAKKRSDAIMAKFEQITPKLNSLKSPDGSFVAQNKKQLSYKTFDKNSWSIYDDIPERQSSNAYNSLANKVEFENGALLLSNHIPRMSAHALFMFYTMRTFKNKEQFDFSKDFQMDVYFDIPEKTRISGLGILIGKSFQLEIVYKGGKNLAISTPSKYKITEQYGFLRSGDWPYNKIDEKVPTSLASVDGHFKVSIVKKGKVFNCLINGQDIKVGNEINYFPDKYFLGFKQAGSDPVSILQIDLKHL